MTDTTHAELKRQLLKAFEWSGDTMLAQAHDRIEELEAKHQETFQMYVDANEARIDAEAETAKLKQMWWDAGDVTDLAGTIAELKAERDALREAVDEVTEYAKRHEAERDALEAKLALVIAAYRIEAMRRNDYSHDAFDQHIAALKGQDDEGH